MNNNAVPNRKGFLVRLNRLGGVNGKTHLWTGSDTACRLWSTGLNASRKTYRFTTQPLTDICSMCHPERYNLNLWAEEAIALEDEQPYTLRP